MLISLINISIISDIIEGISFVKIINNLLNNSINSLKLFSPNNFLWSLKIILSISIDFLLI